MKYMKNKIFIASLTLALCVVTVFSVFYFMGVQNLPAAMIQDAMAPFQNVMTGLSRTFDGYAVYFANMRALYEENQALKEQLKNTELIKLENERLRAYLGMKSKYPSFVMEEGMVISHSAGNYMTGFTLNRGTIHGIKVNMPVAVEEGIVGYVTDVGLNWCMVSTIIETASSVGAYVPRSGATGIVSGDAALRQEGVCKITYLDPSADIAVGDTVLSSGNGSVYPADLLIGEVIAVEADGYSRTLVATVKPAVDFSDLRYMMIITGYES